MATADQGRLERLMRSFLGLTAICVVAGSSANAADDAPDLDFLAYLGSWQESDEEWLAVAEWEEAEQVKDDVRAAAERKDNENES